MAELDCSMTPTELDIFASTIEKLSRGKHLQSPRQTAAQAIFDLTGAERLASYRWDSASRRYHKPVLINLAPTHAQHYLERLQSHDPITPRMRRQSMATRVEDVLPLPDFERLDFYKKFLKPDNMYHGINVFLRRNNRVLCDFRIFRGQSSSAFNQRDLVLIDTILPYLAQALDGPTVSDLDVLTARESQIADLVARGCTDSDIMRILDIQFSTVRTHMNRCFKKVGCANRSELAVFVSQRRRH